MPSREIISRQTITILAEELGKIFAPSSNVTTLNRTTIKNVSFIGGIIRFYSDVDMKTEPIASINLPANMLLDMEQTKLVDNFRWSIETYPNSINPNLEGKPVLVLAIQASGGVVTYSFLDMETLANVYTSGQGDGSTTVNIADSKIAVNVNISKEAGNSLILKTDGLYAAAGSLEGLEKKADLVKGAVAGHLAGLNETGNLTDSGLTASDVLVVGDIDDFTAAEINALLT